MARMLGRYQVPGLCPASRAGRVCIDCGGGESMTARYAKRIEARQVAAEITGYLSREVFDPFTDPSDCAHGCNGSPCNGDRCTFVCHG